MIRSLRNAVAIAALSVLPTAGIAEEAILTITGAGEPVSYDRAELEGMPAVELVTTTIWTEGEQTFTGVPLSALLEAANVTEGVIKATAINDYAVSIPVEDVVGSEWPIVAYALNGEPMSVREKGPLWIVYPYDSGPEYRSEIVYSRSVWQLDRLAIEP